MLAKGMIYSVWLIMITKHRNDVLLMSIKVLLSVSIELTKYLGRTFMWLIS